MTDQAKTTVSELLERVRAATGPDRAIDRKIAEHLVGTPFRSTKRGREWLEDSHGGVETWLRQPTAYTASVDAALALVARKLPGWMVVNLCEWDADVLRARGPWNCTLKLIGTQDDLRAPKGQCHHAPTAPIALLAALLTAKLSQETGNG